MEPQVRNVLIKDAYCVRLGAIFGTASALAMFAWRHKELMGPSADDLLMKLRDTAMINFMYGLVVRRIDNW